MNHSLRSTHFRGTCFLVAGFLASSAACGSSNSGARLGSGGTPGSGGVGIATGGASASGGATVGSTGGGNATPGSGGGTSSGGATAPGGNGGSAVTPAGSSAGATGATGATGAAGAAGTGAAGSAGAGGPGSTPFPAACVTPAVTGSATRPLLTDTSAECFTIKKYLAQAGPIGALVTDNWDPSAGLPDAATLTPTFTVAADGSGTHTTVQAAVTAAKAMGATAAGTARAYILVTPGTYRELVCVDGTVPMTIYGAGKDPTQVTIAFDNYNGKTVDPLQTNGCNIPTTPTYGTSGSSTFFVKSAGFQAMNLTIANDFNEGAITANIQAVALTTQGDQGVFQNVRLLGNQDTLQVKSAAVTTIARVYFKNSTIAGDTDFIFGRAAAVFDGCTINYVAGRKTNSTYIAPSTETLHPYGFLIINSMLTADPGIAGTTYLGRAWDDSSGTMPNGQGVIRNSQIGAQIVVAAPWAPAATSNRGFSTSGNRLYEYQNTGPGAAP